MEATPGQEGQRDYDHEQIEEAEMRSEAKTEAKTGGQPPARGDLVDVLGRCGWRRGIYLRRVGALHRVFVADVDRAFLFSSGRIRPAEHRISVETVVKSGRRRDPPRSRWSCSCGAGRRGLTTPELAHAAADQHFLRGMSER